MRVKVAPRAAKDEIVAWMDQTLKVRVVAVPQGGRANAALEALLARTLHVARNRVRVIRGHASSRKLVEISGLDEAELKRRLCGAE